MSEDTPGDPRRSSPARVSSSESSWWTGAWLAVPVALLAAGSEALLWIALGRRVPVVPVLLLALALGVVGGGLAALLARRRVPARVRTYAVGAGIGLALLPSVASLVDRAGLQSGPTFVAAWFLVAWILGMVAAWCGRLRPVRLALVSAAVVVCSLALLTRLERDSRPALVAAGRHPDVVLIVMDTTRRDRLSLYGHARATTPSIDRLAARARVYDDAWSAAPWTPPSHASLFTGLHPAEHGVDGVRVPGFPADLPSLPDRLQAAGFATAGFVANPNLLGRGWSRGFDVYAPPWFEGPHSATAWLNRVLTRGRPAWLDDEASDRVLRRARRWWSANADAPRFLFLNFVDPHDPYRPLEIDRARIQPDLSREAAFSVPQDPQRYAVAPGVPPVARETIGGLYDAEIAGLDRRLGAFFDWLETRGELDPTLIVITSDHGERLGERGLLGHLLVMDQHLLRVPLVVRHPASVPAERVAERVSLRDLPNELLTLLDLDPLPTPSGAGLSAAVALGRSQPGAPRVVAQHGPFGWYVEQLRARRPDFEASRATRHWTLVAEGDHALLWSPERPDRGRLVRFEDDPSWERDLWDAEPEVREALLAAARGAPRYSEEGDGGASAAGEREEEPLDDALRERLRALGYGD